MFSLFTPLSPNPTSSLTPSPPEHSTKQALHKQGSQENPSLSHTLKWPECEWGQQLWKSSVHPHALAWSQHPAKMSCLQEHLGMLLSGTKPNHTRNSEASLKSEPSSVCSPLATPSGPTPLCKSSAMTVHSSERSEDSQKLELELCPWIVESSQLKIHLSPLGGLPGYTQTEFYVSPQGPCPVQFPQDSNSLFTPEANPLKLWAVICLQLYTKWGFGTS